MTTTGSCHGSRPARYRDRAGAKAYLAGQLLRATHIPDTAREHREAAATVR
ncbi:hypothetical protein [Streptomyces arboris]|uniref:hypothetical protein n=1 Tax=Streptomyces arboris TaxID=2600619 RepID=UPI00178C78DB|nr:hypothetical protein [Streptomyces arboris]